MGYCRVVIVWWGGGVARLCKLSRDLPPSGSWLSPAMTSKLDKFGYLQGFLGMGRCIWSFEQWHTGGHILKEPPLSNKAEPQA